MINASAQHERANGDKATSKNCLSQALPSVNGNAARRVETRARPERVLSTLNDDGSRRWLKPRVSKGRFLHARRIVAYMLIAVFTLLPYVRIHGKPAILLDLTTRHFTIFGTTFLPTDTVLLALLLVGIFVAIFLMTALLGRVWCGWACPQTVYMEFVFRPIERLFEGAPGRKTKGSFRGSGVATALKYAVYLALSLYLAHTFLAYFVPYSTLTQWVRGSPFNHLASFLVVMAVTALMMFDFCFFREQTCIVACPYGRFQSVMLDRQSLIISYDTKRGEPRGKKTASLPVLQRSSANDAISQKGDCVDCQLCVTTCPTGIDIREGLQMECIGCAQCIDACDAVMEKIGRPRGLIRYSSQAAMADGRSRLLRPRVVIYPLILVIIASLFMIALTHRGAANITVLRGLGRPFTEVSKSEIGNQVRIKIVNRSERPAQYMIEAVTPGVRVQTEGQNISIGPGENATVPALVIAPFTMFERGKCQIELRVRDDASFSQNIDWELMGPGSLAAHHESEKDDDHHDQHEH